MKVFFYHQIVISYLPTNMPKSQDHRRQVNHNENVFPKMLDPGINAPDWAITVMFYTILHLFEAFLADRRQIHLKRHKDRHRYFRRNFPNLWVSYERLYNACENARYEVAHLDPSSANFYIELRNNHYLPIKRHLESII